MIDRVGSDLDEARRARDFAAYSAYMAIITVIIIAIYCVARDADDLPDDYYTDRYIIDIMTAANIMKWRDVIETPGHYSRRVDISEIVSAWRLDDYVMAWRGEEPDVYDMLLAHIEEIQYMSSNDYGACDMDIKEIIERMNDVISEITEM